MKTILVGIVTALILSGTAFATGAALDPRVPGLQRQVRNLTNRVNVLTASDANKIDKSCVRLVPVVVRPGYVYQMADGTFAIYKAFDEYNPAIDAPPNRLLDYTCQ